MAITHIGWDLDGRGRELKVMAGLGGGGGITSHGSGDEASVLQVRLLTVSEPLALGLSRVPGGNRPRTRTVDGGRRLGR